MASTRLTSELVIGPREGSQFLYVFEEDQFYTRDGNVKAGANYKCRNRKCPSHVVKLNEHETIKLAKAKAHNHNDGVHQEFLNLKAKQQMRETAKNLHSIASGSRITSSKAIFDDAILQLVSFHLCIAHIAYASLYIKCTVFLPFTQTSKVEF